MRRREFVLGAVGTSLVAALPADTFAAQPPIPYGAAIRVHHLSDDPAYRQAILEHCQIIVGEGGLKWVDLRPDRTTFDFTMADEQMAFAIENGLEMRGHTLIWYAAMPDWVEGITSAEEARTTLVGHIETVVGRYKGRIRSWDVVNEPIADHPSGNEIIRESVWQRHLGPDYIELALRTAASVDPAAQLVINEYDVEQPTDRSRARRKAFLDLVRSLKQRGAPLHAIGLQGHLRGELDIDRSGLTSFVAELVSMDLEILVTELDVIDKDLPGPEAERDAIIASRAKDFLGAIGAVTRPKAVISWGITDKYTWVPIWFTRDDGRPNRPLPLDSNYAEKPLMQAIKDFTNGVS
jgi:endo-1,4-beta-xylanase